MHTLRRRISDPEINDYNVKRLPIPVTTNVRNALLKIAKTRVPFTTKLHTSQ